MLNPRVKHSAFLLSPAAFLPLSLQMLQFCLCPAEGSLFLSKIFQVFCFLTPLILVSSLSLLVVLLSLWLCVWECESCPSDRTSSLSSPALFSGCGASPCFQRSHATGVWMCFRTLLNPIHLFTTHAHMHTSTRRTAQLTIILMPICLIVGFLIPKAPSRFQQGPTVLARDGLLFVRVRVCAWVFVSMSVMPVFSGHPAAQSGPLIPFSFLSFTVIWACQRPVDRYEWVTCTVSAHVHFGKTALNLDRSWNSPGSQQLFLSVTIKLDRFLHCISICVKFSFPFLCFCFSKLTFFLPYFFLTLI